MQNPLLMRDMLELFNGNKTEAVKHCKVSRRTLSGLSETDPVPDWVAASVRDYLLKTRGSVPRKWMPR